MGNCNSNDNEIQKQENNIIAFRQQYSGDLTCGGKYTTRQINSKLRQLYYGIDNVNKNDYILDADYKWKHDAKSYLQNRC